MCVPSSGWVLNDDVMILVNSSDHTHSIQHLGNHKISDKLIMQMNILYIISHTHRRTHFFSLSHTVFMSLTNTLTPSHPHSSTPSSLSPPPPPSHPHPHTSTLTPSPSHPYSSTPPPPSHHHTLTSIILSLHPHTPTPSHPHLNHPITPSSHPHTITPSHPHTLTSIILSLQPPCPICKFLTTSRSSSTLTWSPGENIPINARWSSPSNGRWSL